MSNIIRIFVIPKGKLLTFKTLIIMDEEMKKEFDLFEAAGNKSLSEVEYLVELAETSIRLYASRHLIDHDEDNPLDIDAELDYRAMGLSSLEIPHVTKIFQSKTEGIISVMLEGCDYPQNLDEFDIHDQISIIREL